MCALVDGVLIIGKVVINHNPERYIDMGKIRNMKYWLAGAALVCVSGIAGAEIVSQKQASGIAQTFFNAAYGRFMTAPKLAWNGRQLTTDRLFAPFYIYNHPAGGFVIISGENKAYPILGYSRTGKFDRSKLNDEEQDLLSQYAHEIELIRYDSRVPERAIAAWQNLPVHISGVLENPYSTPEFGALTDEAQEKIERIDRRNNSIMMPSAVEFEIYNPENYRSYTLDDVSEEDDYITFSLFEDFMRDIEEETRARQAALEELISPTRPVVSLWGGAHYTVKFPSEVRMARVYSVQGKREQERYFRNTDTVNLDLSALPAGYYVLVALDEAGKLYGVKLAR